MSKSLRICPLLLATFALVGACSAQEPRAGATPPTPLLLQDTRLKGRIVLAPGDTTTGRIFQLVQQSTAVRLHTEDSELKAARLAAGCNNAQAVALMDALSALWLSRWERDKERRYRLIAPEAVDLSHLAKNSHERERSATGQQFSALVRRLDPETRRYLMSDKPIPAANLTPELLTTVRALTASINRERELGGDENPFPLSRLPESAIRFRASNRGSHTSYFVTVSLPNWGSMGWRFTDDVREAAKPGDTASAALYVPRRHEMKRQASAESPRLRRKVEIDLTQATLLQVLTDLHRRYGIPFVSDSGTIFRQRADIRLSDVELGDALDELKRLYKGSEWEIRKLGFIVFRSDNNPAVKQDPLDEEKR